MAKKRVELVTHSFLGPRFEDHGLDVDVLSELIAYKILLVETAKELWRRNNPDRQRLPKNFEDSLCIKFYELRDGSTSVPLVREIEYDPNLFPFEEPRDELDEAVDLVAEVSDTASNDKPLPEAFPKRLLSQFDNYGKTLHENESFEQKPSRWEKSARYSIKTRERLTHYSEREYEDTIDFIGEVRAADLDGCNFTIRKDDGIKISGKFNTDQEVIITDALRDHESQRIRVKGRAEFSSPEGKIKRILSVEDIILQPAGEPEYDPTARPIWEIAAEISASVPDEEWEKVPTDLSKNFDHYLYGAPKEDE